MNNQTQASSISTDFDQLGSSDLESDTKIPYVIKDKILMSPGVWNDYYYSLDSIKAAYNGTDWEDKEIRSLFLDHEDRKSKDWIGEVLNPRLSEDGVVRGDLVVVDKPSAIKLAYGAKFGVSPKVKGEAEESTMKEFIFKNFSVVMGPAIKTAYINNQQKEVSEMREVIDELKLIIENAQVTDMERKRKQLGMGVSQFYAIPRDPPSSSKLPIFDAAHVRNALARFNQVTGVSAEERARAKSKIFAAAKKFGIKVKEEKKMAEEEKKEESPVEEKKEDSVEEEMSQKQLLSSMKEMLDSFKKEVEVKNSEMDMDLLASKVADIIENRNSTKEMSDEEPKEEEEKPSEEEPKEEEKAEDKDKVVEEMQHKIKELTEKLNEPEDGSEATQELSQKPSNPFKNLSISEADEGMINFLKGRTV